ncbi:MAG: molybdenum cofactor guanylyltransferase [Acidimicrobiales bacterium]
MCTVPPPTRPRLATLRHLERRLSDTVAAILCGGQSRRMGQDKALVEIDGQPLVARIADRCHRGGINSVVAVGGSRAPLEALGIPWITDRWPGAGPLGGIITALGASTPDSLVYIVAVDVPGLPPDAVHQTVAALAADPTADVALPLTADGRRHHLQGAWRPRTAPVLERLFDHGERAVRRCLSDLAVADVTGLDPSSFTDVDTPEDLAAWTRGHGNTSPDR